MAGDRIRSELVGCAASFLWFGLVVAVSLLGLGLVIRRPVLLVVGGVALALMVTLALQLRAGRRGT